MSASSASTAMWSVFPFNLSPTVNAPTRLLFPLLWGRHSSVSSPCVAKGRAPGLLPCECCPRLSRSPSQAVGSPGCYFPVCENPRHSRGLGWHAPVSVRQFLPFRSVGAGFGRRSLVAIFQFPFRWGRDRFDCRQRPVRRAPLGGLVGADAAAINERTFVFRRMHYRGQRCQHLLLVLGHNPTLCSCSIQE
jgi:hypothetical protein